MLELKTREKLADAARVLASSFELIVHRGALYLPVDCLTGRPTPPPAKELRVWKVLDRKSVQRLANSTLKILFANESELINFEGMLKQLAAHEDDTPTSVMLLVRGELQVFHADGKLSAPTGKFIPNFIETPLNQEKSDMDEVMSVLNEWVDGVEEAESLLRHLSTALSPGWSAVKYVLLLGEGRNGKSVLLHMLRDLFGLENVSDVTRQQMSEKSPVCADLNGKLLNIVMDGPMEYVKDSGMEKTLIAGETGSVRRLYESTLTPVQTNALFLEGLNQEPKTRDKSSALQKRLSRFWFPQEYPLNPQFSAHMRSTEMLGALLALMMDNLVTQDNAATGLALTDKAQDLQLDQMVLNSIAMQYLNSLAEDSKLKASKLIGADVMPLVNAFIPWATAQEGNMYSESEALQMFKRVFHLRRSSRRNKSPRNYWKITGLRPEITLLLEQHKGGDNDPSGMVVDE